MKPDKMGGRDEISKGGTWVKNRNLAKRGAERENGLVKETYVGGRGCFSKLPVREGGSEQAALLEKGKGVKGKTVSKKMKKTLKGVG